ncbi:polysaccharide deacetylase family protein [Cohnella fermenti]|uniref:Polysaccharide deacetylase family protein n=1 Tax=Cohnella fermenti TaxID=2565925 RepID=A0A4S4C391_9BACL|nr:polysaccharide deacetylase family protein [Cohnella fermenti]THF82207.1 polysaccharide deacetylase family protein [Cohnella fermenti]
MGMETYSTLVMELLSLGRTPTGAYQIKVAVTHDDKLAKYLFDIDEFTYAGLEKLQPLEGQRARLSPYPKWDPYHQTYYSAVVRMNGSSRETFYFACSEAFIELIRTVRENGLNGPNGLDGLHGLRALPVPLEEERAEAAGGRAKKKREQQRRPAWKPGRTAKAASLLLVPALVGLMALALPTGGQTDLVSLPAGELGIAQAGGQTEASARAASSPAPEAAAAKDEEKRQQAPILAEHADLTGAAGAFSAVGAVGAAGSRAAGEPAATQADLKPEAGYEVIEIGDQDKFFGLPKEYVALTFDDGPSSLTEKIVDVLTENEVAATFLFVGKNIGRHSEAVAYASDHGMSIGNHSWDHSVLTKVSAEDQAANLAKTNDAIEALTGNPVTLFRPPYGAVDEALVGSAEKLGMKTLLWNRDPEDWNAKKPDDILRYFHEVEGAGGVYVMHEDKYTLEALPEIIQYLKDKELKFAIFK